MKIKSKFALGDVVWVDNNPTHAVPEGWAVVVGVDLNTDAGKFSYRYTVATNSTVDFNTGDVIERLLENELHWLYWEVNEGDLTPFNDQLEIQLVKLIEQQRIIEMQIDNIKKQMSKKTSKKTKKTPLSWVVRVRGSGWTRYVVKGMKLGVSGSHEHALVFRSYDDARAVRDKYNSLHSRRSCYLPPAPRAEVIRQGTEKECMDAPEDHGYLIIYMMGEKKRFVKSYKPWVSTEKEENAVRFGTFAEARTAIRDYLEPELHTTKLAWNATTPMPESYFQVVKCES